jgi:hypothetical protein
VTGEIRASAPAHATGAVEFVSLDDIAEDDRFRLRPEGDVSALASSLGRLGQLVPIEVRPWPGAASDGPRWQVVSGFRRLAALKLLHRDRVLARVHGALAEDEAWALALVQAILDEPLTATEIDALRARLDAEGAAPWASELLDEALVRAPLDPELRERFFEFLKGPLPAPIERVEDAAGEAGLEVARADPQAAEPAEARPEEHSIRAEPVEARVEPEIDVVEVDADDLLRGLATRLYEVNQDLATAFASWKDLPLEGRQLVLAQARYVAELFPFLHEGTRG